MARTPNRTARRKAKALERKAPQPAAPTLATGTPTPAQTQGMVFSALPDNYTIKLKLGSDGAPLMVMPGRIVLPRQMKDRLAEQSRETWYPEPDETALKDAQWMINMLADPDRYRRALTYLDRALRGTSMPVFNTPREILETSRDVIWRKLADVPHLTAPKCIRFSPKSPQDFTNAFKKGNFDYPVMIRPAGTHTGRELLLISSEKDWRSIFGMAWGGREIYMTQWTDFQNAAGEWAKIRLVITPDRIMMRHILYGEGWLIHSVDRGPEEAERELDVLGRFDSWTRLHELGAAVRERVGLDYFGIDIGWKSDDEFVLFEANASMSIISRNNMPTHRRDEFEAIVTGIEDVVWKAMMKKLAL
ncbi:MAG: hypothetical protein AAFM92_13945 [Pseudomonadota bacterium]